LTLLVCSLQTTLRQAREQNIIDEEYRKIVLLYNESMRQRSEISRNETKIWH